MSGVRQSNGTFAPGRSGNPNGRPVRERPNHALPAKNRKAIFRVAEREIDVKLEGKVERLTLFEAAILQLGVSAAKGDRVSARLFVQTVMGAAETDLGRKVAAHEVIDHMNRLEVENDRMRSRLSPKGGVVISNHPLESVSSGACLDDEPALPPNLG